MWIPTLSALALAIPYPQDCATEVTPSQGIPTTRFGESIAVEGDRLVVATQRDASWVGAGVVEIIDRDPATGAWQLTARVETTGFPQGGVLARGAVAFDGDRVVFGNWNDDSAGPRTGAASVIERDPVTQQFVERQVLRASDAAGGDAFGSSVATDGQVIVVSAPFHNGGGSVAGALYFFERGAGGQWVEVQQILGMSPSALYGSQLGRPLALEGRELIARSETQNPLSGALHVIRRDPATGVWGLHQTITSPVTDDFNFGFVFDLDGNRMIAAGGDNFSSTRKVYVLEKPSAPGDWAIVDVISAPGPSSDFGHPLALSGDRIACRSREPQPVRDTVRQYRRDAATGEWEPAPRLLPPSAGGGALGVVHSDLALTDERLFVGDRFADNTTGAVYIHDLGPDCDGDGWADPCQLLARPDDDLDQNGQVDSCELVGVLICAPAANNSTGRPGRLVPLGSDVLADQALTLYLDDLPTGPPGYMLVSREAGFVPNAGGSVGDLCISSATSFGRFASMIMNAPPSGRLTFAVPLGSIPQPMGPIAAQVGETWYFQYWHRDWAQAVPLSNLTNAAGITLR